MNADVRTDPFAHPSVYLPSKPDLLAVHGLAARTAWDAWNMALDARCLHEIDCKDGCRNTLDCCPEGGRLAIAEHDAYIAWDTLATDAGVPSEAEYTEADDTTSDLLRGLWIGGSISAITWGGIALVWFVFHLLSRGGR